MSVWQTPQATRRTSTSPARGLLQLELLHLERLAELLQHRCTHSHLSQPPPFEDRWPILISRVRPSGERLSGRERP